MKQRTAKKIAKRYLDTGVMPKRYSVYHDQEWRWTDTWVSYFSPVSDKLRCAIYAEAYRRGWDGYWAEDPLIVEVRME